MRSGKGSSGCHGRDTLDRSTRQGAVVRGRMQLGKFWEGGLSTGTTWAGGSCMGPGPEPAVRNRALCPPLMMAGWEPL